MTIDERRQAWRAYMTAMLSAADFHDCTMDTLADSADYLLKTEQQRFDSPDHSGDANKMVERPWVGLTDAERAGHIFNFVGGVLTTPKLYALLEKVEQQLQVKNRGTR